MVLHGSNRSKWSSFIELLYDGFYQTLSFLSKCVYWITRISFTLHQNSSTSNQSIFRFWVRYLCYLIEKKKLVSSHFHISPLPPNQYIQNKIRNKSCMIAIDYVFSKLQAKVTRGIENNRSNFINIIGNKFVMSIKWGK